MRAGEGSCHVTSLAAARCTCSRQSGREGWRSSSERQVQGHLAEEALEQTVRLDGFALMVESSAQGWEIHRISPCIMYNTYYLLYYVLYVYYFARIIRLSM